MLTLWLFLFFTQKPGSIAEQLPLLMTNSSKGLTSDGSYIDTVAKLSREKGAWKLVIEEQLYDAPNGSKGLFERHILHIDHIDSVRLYLDTKRDTEGRNTYLILTYRQSEKGIYSFKDRDERKFGPLLAFRIGVYKRDTAERIKQDIAHLRSQP